MTMFISYDGESTVTVQVGAEVTRERVIFASDAALVLWAEARFAVSGCTHLQIQAD